MTNPQGASETVESADHVDTLGLSPRALNFFNRNRIDTVDQLVRISEDELKAMPGLGPTLLQHIKERLAANKMKLLYRTRVDRIKGSLWPR